MGRRCGVLGQLALQPWGPQSLTQRDTVGVRVPEVRGVTSRGGSDQVSRPVSGLPDRQGPLTPVHSVHREDPSNSRQPTDAPVNLAASLPLTSSLPRSPWWSLSLYLSLPSLSLSTLREDLSQ